MKKIIYIMMSLVLVAQAGHASALRNLTSTEAAEALFVTTDDTKEVKLKKLLAMKDEAGKLRMQVEEKRRKIKVNKIAGVVGIAITVAAAVLFFKTINGDIIEAGIGVTLSLPLAAIGVGTTGYNGYRLYANSDKLEELEKELANVEVELQKQIDELNKE